jgi:hypothetical protein
MVNATYIFWVLMRIFIIVVKQLIDIAVVPFLVVEIHFLKSKSDY